MLRFLLSGFVGGCLFAVLDGILNANPLAQRAYELYKPIARLSINVQAGVVIDLAYGFLLAAVFLLLYHSLPGHLGILKGLSYGLLVWFFRVVMSSLGSWVVFKMGYATLAYSLGAGLVEMLALGVFYGLTLHL